MIACFMFDKTKRHANDAIIISWHILKKGKYKCDNPFIKKLMPDLGFVRQLLDIAQKN